MGVGARSRIETGQFQKMEEWVQVCLAKCNAETGVQGPDLGLRQRCDGGAEAESHAMCVAGTCVEASIAAGKFPGSFVDGGESF